MKLSEFASIYKVSERHVRRLIQKYEADMVGHYEQRGNEGTYIDNVGVDILKSKLRTKVEVVVDVSERERQLQATITELSLRYAAAMEKLNEAAGTRALLEAAEDRANDAVERAAQAEAERMQLEAAFKASEEYRVKAELRAEDSTREAERAQAEAEDLRAQLEQIAAARGFKRRKLLKELKELKGGKHG